MATDQLSPPGTGVYSSDTMYVGDGTWDSSRNTFLLPNLQGLNFATMQYNGMGNRFRTMTGYKSVVKAHGIIAAITFLLVVPAAILIARFYHRNPRQALRLHIWLQIFTVLLSTAAFILGFQAVGPARSLTNPHHGIGVALYVMVMVQALGGAIIHRIEKGKERYRIPLKLMLHQWLGRTIALLGIVQVALGLTLYGSPKVLFILYAIWGFLLLLAYFIMTYRHQPDMAFDDYGTYISERTRTSRRSRSRSRHGHGLGTLAAAGAAGAGLAALRNRSRSRRRPSGSRQDVISSRHSSHHSESYVDDEKYTEDGREQHTWRNRIFGAAAGATAIAAARKLFSRRKDNETMSDVSYGRPITETHSVSQTDLSRIEEGRAPASPRNDHWRRVEEREAAQAAAMTGSPLRQVHTRHRSRSRRSGASISSFTTESSFSDEITTPPKSHGARNTIGALAGLGFARRLWNRRKGRKEDELVEQQRRHEIEEERIARANSARRKYTGDGVRPPRRGSRRAASTIDEDYSDISGATPALSRHNLPPPPMHLPTSSKPPPAHGSRTHVTNSETAPPPSTVPMPPAPPDPQGILHESGSEAYTSPGGRHHRRHRPGSDAALAAGAGAAAASSSRRDTSRQRSSNGGSVASPPVSVKVKMHNDGRHVTLRRLNEEEAAAEREARRRERQRRNKDGSVSSLSNVGNDRWRRTEALEAAQARQEATAVPPPPPPPAPAPAPIPMPEPFIPPPPPGPPPHQVPVSQEELGLPPPPPIPAATPSGMSSPPGTNPYSGTDVSNYDSNRRRRRAERAQAKQARMGGSRVEFS